MNESVPAPAISARDVVLSYGERRALDGVSLEVAAGAIVGLLGPNGSGKSTLLSLVAGLRVPETGELRVLGAQPRSDVRRRIGVVFQESCLDLLMTLEETLVLHGRLFGLGGATLRRSVESALGGFGLAARSHDAVRTLSGGLRRRLELARALLPSPEVLLLDEPTTGLDPDSRRAFWELLRSAQESTRRRGFPASPDRPPRLESLGSGKERAAAMPPKSFGGAQTAPLTILTATNDVLEAERECDTVAFLSNGRLVAQGTPDELKRGLRHDSVRVECVDGRAAGLSRQIADWPGVGRVTSAGSILQVTVDDVSSFVPRLFQTDPQAIHTIRIEPSTLEDAYFAVAGSPLRAELDEALSAREEAT
jgi:ABC-2 type transport system ATP-binding protein